MDDNAKVDITILVHILSKGVVVRSLRVELNSINYHHIGSPYYFEKSLGAPTS
jgi:hypothetical protein